jgi:hypothetical protein
MSNRVFEHFPQTGSSACPICGDNHDDATVLVPIHGTQDGFNVEAVPTHVQCVIDNLQYSKEQKLMGLETKL